MADGELMLTEGLKTCNFLQAERQNGFFGLGGFSAIVDYGPPYWELELEYENLSDANFRVLTAWMRRRRGGMSYFKAFRAMSRNPLGGASSATVAQQTSDTLRVTSSPVLQIGDMVAYDANGSGRFVGEVIEIVATAAGYVDVKTFPPISVPASTPNAEIVDAGGYFRVLPDTVRLSEPLGFTRSMSFRARQLEPTDA